MIHPAHLAHVASLHHAIAHSRAYGGLARSYTGWLLRAIGPVTIPAGWGARTDINEDRETVMPLWLAWPLDLWGNRWHWTLGRLQRWGLWQVTGKGHDYRVGRLVPPRWMARAWAKVRRVAWCFLNDRDATPYGMPGNRRFSDRPIYGAPFFGRTPRQYTEAEETYILGVGWRHVNDSVTDDDLRKLGWDA